MKDCILATKCPIVILILISFSFHKPFSIDIILLSGNQLLFLSQIVDFNLYISNKQEKSIYIP